MALGLIREETAKFIHDSSASVLLLRGHWGTGKTFFWQKLVEECARDKSIGRANYAYVSLFGLHSLEELKNAILLSQIKSSEIASGHGSKLFSSKRILNNLEKLPKIQEWTGGLATSLAFVAVRNVLICFDDLERKGEDLNYQEIFGLVSILKEQRNCSVAVIANEDTLDDESKERFQRYSEKLVDVNLEFFQTPTTAFELASDSSFPYRDLLKELCLRLNIVNIRILRRLHHLARGILSLLEQCEADVVRETLSSLVLFVWCYYDKGINTPPFSYVKNLDINRFVEINRREGESKEKSWNALLRDYGYIYTNELDLLLAAYVERGYIDTQAFRVISEEKNKSARAEAASKYHWQAWDLYYNSFNDNEESFIEALTTGFRSKMELLRLSELSQTIAVLRRFGRDEIANNLIDDYLTYHQEEMADLRSTNQLGVVVDDLYLRQKLEDLIRSNPDMRELGDIVKKITKSNSWNREDIEFLATAPSEEYYNFFSQEYSPQLKDYVKRCLAFTGQEIIIAEKATEALRRLAAENRINAVRVESIYGISLAETSPE